MVREIVYVWQGATYREIKSVLKSNKRLQSFPLVESSGESLELESSYCPRPFCVLLVLNKIILNTVQFNIILLLFFKLIYDIH